MTVESLGKLLLWIGLSAGNAKLWVEFVNRTHAGRLSCQSLHHLRIIHDFAVLAVPVFLAWEIFFRADTSHITTTFNLTLLPLASPLHLVWQVFLICCLSGLCWIGWSAGEHLTRTLPTPHLQKTSQVFDVTQELGYRPHGNGIHPRLALFPLNEQFKVELSRKEFFIPALPIELDGLRIMHLSDWHFHGSVDRPYYEFVVGILSQEQADLVVFTGDLLDDMGKLDWIAPTLGRLKGESGQYFILGNHDWYLDPDRIRQTACECGWTDVNSRTVSISVRGRRLDIGGDETPWMGTSPRFHLADAADFRILLSHTPDNFPRAVREGIPLVLAGHNHGGQVRLPVLGPVYSPSKFSTLYASGEFVSKGTFMHVSRGLSGRHPYRFHCLPEVTILTLRTQLNQVHR